MSTLPNGFDGAWNPICPECGGYMHAGHTDDCSTTKHQERQNARILAALRKAANSHSQAGS